MLFVEPNHEGPSPALASTACVRCAQTAWGKRPLRPRVLLEVSGQPDLERPPPPARARSRTSATRAPPASSSSASTSTSTATFSTHFEVLEKRFFHYFSGHASNAFYVFMKSRLVRATVARGAAGPGVVRRRLLSRPEYQRYAEEGLWFLRQKPGGR
jgi:hypothetical protein